MNTYLVSIRVPMEILKKLDKKKDEERRSRNSQIIHYIEQGLKRDITKGDKNNEN